MPTYYVVEYHTITYTYKVEAEDCDDALNKYDEEGVQMGEEAFGCDDVKAYLASDYEGTDQ